MSIRIVCIDPNAVAGNEREIAVTGQRVAFGEEVEIEDPALAGSPPSGDPDSEKYDLGSGLLAQTAVWAKPTTKAAHEATKAAKTIARTVDRSETEET